MTKLGILKKQIYSLATDSGSNVSKAGELIRNDFALPENFADQNDEDNCNVTEATDSELWEDEITAENVIITVRCAVYTLQIIVHDFFRPNSSAKEVVSTERNVAKKLTSRISGSCSGITTKFFLVWTVRPVGVQRF